MALMLLDTFDKQPAENYPIGVDFVNQLPVGTTLVSGTVTGRVVSTGVTDNTILASTTAQIAGTQAKARVQAGTNNVQYKISFVVTLSDGSILEEDILMNVKDL